MKLLVTGATGFLGSALVPMLREAGHEVRLLVRSGAAVPDPETVKGDVRDPDSVARAMAGVEGVYHLAGLVSRDQYVAEFVDDPLAALQEGDRRLLDVGAGGARQGQLRGALVEGLCDLDVADGGPPGARAAAVRRGATLAGSEAVGEDVRAELQAPGERDVRDPAAADQR